MTDSRKFSIVIPVYNEETNMEELYHQIISVITHLTGYYELIFVDDGSNDGTFEAIKKLNQQDAKVTGISLSRNFGHQVALLAGLEEATGEIVITMDGDLQHPPEVINSMFDKFKEGYDIINTRRLDTKGEGVFKKASSGLFYKLINKLSDLHIESGSADFRLMSRKAVDAFLRFPERDRFTRGLVSWMGFRQAVVDYIAPPRHQGKSKYSYRKMIRFGLDGITSFSSKPLRISFYSGFIIFLLGVAYAIYAIINYMNSKTIQGWTSILVSVLILGGFQLLTIGIVGEYIARIFNETKARPLYFIKEKTDVR